MFLSVANADAALASFISTSGTYYLGLNTASPGVTGANEVTGGSYGRQAIQFTTAASGGATASTDAQAFTSMPSCTIGYFSVWSASSGGTFEWGGQLTAPLTVASGSAVNIPIGDIAAAMA